MRLREALVPLTLLVGACTPEDTTEEVIAVVSSGLGPACNEVEPLSFDMNAVTPSAGRQDVLSSDQAICYVFQNPCPGWLTVDARPLGSGSLRLHLHEGFDVQLGQGHTVEESRSHHFELQAIHAYLEAPDSAMHVIRVIADPPDAAEGTPFSLWVAFLPRWRDCTEERPEADDGPHRTAYNGRLR